jgi:hypothetical protein
MLYFSKRFMGFDEVWIWEAVTIAAEWILLYKNGGNLPLCSRITSRIIGKWKTGSIYSCLDTECRWVVKFNSDCVTLYIKNVFERIVLVDYVNSHNIWHLNGITKDKNIYPGSVLELKSCNELYIHMLRYEFDGFSAPCNLLFGDCVCNLGIINQCGTALRKSVGIRFQGK